MWWCHFLPREGGLGGDEAGLDVGDVAIVGVGIYDNYSWRFDRLSSITEYRMKCWKIQLRCGGSEFRYMAISQCHTHTLHSTEYRGTQHQENNFYLK